jgi:hypothetical protein
MRGVGVRWCCSPCSWIYRTDRCRGGPVRTAARPFVVWRNLVGWNRWHVVLQTRKDIQIPTWKYAAQSFSVVEFRVDFTV